MATHVQVSQRNGEGRRETALDEQKRLKEAAHHGHRVHLLGDGLLEVLNLQLHLLRRELGLPGETPVL